MNDALAYRFQRLIAGGNTITHRGKFPERFPDYSAKVLRVVYAMMGSTWLDRAEAWYNFREIFADNRDEFGRMQSLQTYWNCLSHVERRFLEEF